MAVSDAVDLRSSIRAFLPDPVPGALVREIIEKAKRSPSGGNVQPWFVHALSGEPLREFKAIIADKIESSDGSPRAGGGAYEPTEYEVYPADLWEPHRTYRFECGEDMYRTIGVERADKAGRIQQFKNNFAFFGAPVGLFFTLERRMGPPQWSDVGMFMQTLMLLAVEAGLDTCPQECWNLFPQTIGKVLDLPPEQLLFSGMSLGYRDPSAPINTLRTKRASFEAFATLRGFDK